MGRLRIVHYLNQFFGGLGGEEQNQHPVTGREGPVGPGRAVEEALGDAGAVVGTVICGDSYFVENKEASLEAILAQVREWRADLLVAGPAFNAGRYGIACAEVCYAAGEAEGIPAVTGMHPENPGAELHRPSLYVVPTGSSAAGMVEAVARMVPLGLQLARGEPVGPAPVEGYLPRGPRINELRGETAAARAVSLLQAKLSGEGWASEVPLEVYGRVPAAPPLADPTRATIALVSESGLVPLGNPDGLTHVMCQRWAAYDLQALDDFRQGEYEMVHGGCDARYALENPCRMVPVDVLREMAAEGRVGAVHKDFLVTVGNGNPVSNAARLGREMAGELREAGVEGVILTST